MLLSNNLNKFYFKIHSKKNLWMPKEITVFMKIFCSTLHVHYNTLFDVIYYHLASEGEMLALQ